MRGGKKGRGPFKPQTSDENDGYDPGYDANYEQPKKWFEEISPDSKGFHQVTDQILIELKDEAKKCLDSEVATYNIKNAKTNSDYRWMKTVMTKGTVSDRIAAYTVLIQDNPACNLDTIRNLIGMVKVGKKKECVAVIETLSELFISDLLRPNMKLKSFYTRPLSLLNDLSSGNAVTRRKYLSYWYFEDQLKEAYTTFVLALNAAAHDTVDSNKEKAIAAMGKLLAGNPEQEKNLLSHVINKLGDPSQKVASKTMYCLSQLLHKHSNMQAVVLKEVEKLLFRQNIGHRAQYYSICFISQFYLSHDSPEVARKLIEVYFSFFKKCIKEGEVDTRMMSALLIGVNRAYPYAKMELEKISEHIDTMYRVVHIASFNVSLHALSLLYQVSEYSDNVNDRFYSALYKKLLDSKLSTTTNQALLLNLVYKSLMRDTEKQRIKAFIKRLLQVCLHIQPGFACGVLFLVSQIIKKSGVDAMHLKKSTAINDDDDEEKYSDVKDETENQTTSEETEDQLKADEEQEEIKPDVEELNASGLKAGWCHKNKLSVRDAEDYNPLARNPLYAGADFSAFVELHELKNHCHPSVALFAQKLLYSETIAYSGDPLKDFTLIRFLDRFVFKNPKKSEDVGKWSHTTFGNRKTYKPSGIRALSVTSSNYLNEKEKNIPVEELFMYNYLQKRYGNKEDKDEDNSDDESVASEEFEDMLNKMSGFKDIDDDIDYMNEIGESLKKKDKAQRKSGDDDDDEDADSDDDSDADSNDEEISDDEDDMDEIGEAADIDELGDEDFDDDEINDDDKDILQGLDDDDDDDESDIVFDSDEEDEKTTSKKSKKSKKKTNDNSSIFASAEEFASILEDEGSSKIAPGSTNQFANKDKADVKQLDWEDKRNRWLTGFKKAVGGKGGKFNGKEKSFNKKRSNKGTFSGQNKKQKRF